MAKKRRKRKYEIVYLAVSADRYKLPTAIFFSLREACAWECCSVNAMRKKIKYHERSQTSNCFFEVVILEQKFEKRLKNVPLTKIFKKF